jgi:hypothetical protein
MKPVPRLVLALALGGAVVFALGRWLRPQSVFELVSALALCR